MFINNLNIIYYSILYMNYLPKQIKNREILGSRITYTRNSNSIDKCIICKCHTDYKVKVPISNRNFYVEGCGQLCGSCYFACYNTSTTDDFQQGIFE